MCFAISFNVGSFAEFLIGEKLLNTGLIGLCVLVSSLLASPGRFQRAGVVVALVMAVVYFATTYYRTTFWRSTDIYLEKAIEFEPNYFRAHHILGREYFEMGRYEDARREFEKSVALAPEFSDAYNSLGNTYYQLGRIEKAYLAWREAARRDRSNPTSYFNMGLAMERLGDPSAALGYYEKALALQPSPAKAMLEKIERLRALGITPPKQPYN